LGNCALPISRDLTLPSLGKNRLITEAKYFLINKNMGYYCSQAVACAQSLDNSYGISIKMSGCAHFCTPTIGANYGSERALIPLANFKLVARFFTPLIEMGLVAAIYSKPEWNSIYAQI